MERPTLKDISYLFTHGYCGHYAFYLYQNDPRINGVVALCVEDENEEANTVHIFATDGISLYDIYGKCDYSDREAMKHIETNFQDILVEYADNDTSGAWLDDFPCSDDFIPGILNAPLSDIDGVSTGGLNTLQLIDLKKELELSEEKPALFLGNCVNSFDEDGNAVVSDMPYSTTSEFACGEEDSEKITYEYFLKITKLESIEDFVKDSTNSEFLLDKDKGIAMIYDNATDIHFFFKLYGNWDKTPRIELGM